MITLRRGALASLLSLCAVSSACGKTADAVGSAGKEKPAAPETAVESVPSATAAPDKVVVYYFHGTRRCPTCLGIQKAIEETIEEKFARELEANLLTFEELNFEEEKNKPYVEKFELSFSTMIVAAKAGNAVVKWENAGKIWELATAEDALKAYVETRIRAYLKLAGAG